MAFPLETLFLRPEIDIGSNILLPARGFRPAYAENGTLYRFPGASAPGDVHAAACGLQSKGYSPSMHPGNFVNSLNHRYPSVFFCFVPLTAFPK